MVLHRPVELARFTRSYATSHARGRVAYARNVSAIVLIMPVTMNLSAGRLVCTEDLNHEVAAKKSFIDVSSDHCLSLLFNGLRTPIRSESYAAHFVCIRAGRLRTDRRPRRWVLLHPQTEPAWEVRGTLYSDFDQRESA